jgi:2-amino-4-hydroxy-6-hydroxymethyldihydropteridine diphosphokinase
LKLQAVLGFGANLGERLETMRLALHQVRAVARVLRTSQVYRTTPIGPVQPDFLNAAALVEYQGPPEALLEELLTIEGRLGRVRGQRWGPRIIDLDFLWADGLVVEGPRLLVPHPRLKERAFALVPLLEIVANARDPRTGERYVAPAGDVRPTSEWL